MKCYLLPVFEARQIIKPKSLILVGILSVSFLLLVKCFKHSLRNFEKVRNLQCLHLYALEGK